MSNKTTMSAGVVALLFSLWPIPATNGAEKPIRGYSPSASETQRQFEKDFNSIPSHEEARRWHRYFTSVPHPAGSERTKEIAHYIEKNWKEQGLDDVNLTVGGVIPHRDITKLKKMGVAEVFPGGTSFEDIITGIHKLFE